jgi:hypothetical protein
MVVQTIIKGKAAPPWGQPWPLPPTAAAPATGPSAGPEAWSWGRAAVVAPEHGAGYSFLWPLPAAVLGPSVGPCPPRTHGAAGQAPVEALPDRGCPGCLPYLPGRVAHAHACPDGHALLLCPIGRGGGYALSCCPWCPLPCLRPAPCCCRRPQRLSPSTASWVAAAWPPPLPPAGPVRPPLPAPGGKVGDGTPTPLVKMPCPEIISKL